MSKLWLLIICCWAGLLHGQTPTAPADTAALLSDQPIKSPTGAMLRSVVLPGWGQLYNESRLKAGGALLANGALIGSIFYYDDRRQKEADPLKRNSLKDRRDSLIWIWGLTYLLTIADAYVGAYLFGFDEAMDIAWQPPDRRFTTWQLSLRFSF